MKLRELQREFHLSRVKVREKINRKVFHFSYLFSHSKNLNFAVINVVSTTL